MKKALKIILAVVALLALIASIPAYRIYSELRKGMSEDPLVWEEDIRALEASTAGLFPPREGVVFIGSSSIRLWATLTEDMAPVPVIQHGFGGAKLNDVVHYAERLVNAYQPRMIVVFAGTNDVTPEAAKTPAVLLQHYQAFVGTARAGQPNLPIYYIAITPSPRRWAVWDIAQETNRLIAQWSARQKNLHVIDTGLALLNSDGVPDAANYVVDGLHLSKQGYAVWTRLIKPPLLAELGLAGSE